MKNRSNLVMILFLKFRFQGYLRESLLCESVLYKTKIRYMSIRSKTFYMWLFFLSHNVISVVC